MFLVPIFVRKYRFDLFFYLSQFGHYFGKFDAIRSFPLVLY